MHVESFCTYYVATYVCVCVYIHMCIYIYTHTYIFIYTHRFQESASIDMEVFAHDLAPAENTSPCDQALRSQACALPGRLEGSFV